mgnify:CR=1 FL=1
MPLIKVIPTRGFFFTLDSSEDRPYPDTDKANEHPSQNAQDLPVSRKGTLTVGSRRGPGRTRLTRSEPRHMIGDSKEVD